MHGVTMPNVRTGSSCPTAPFTIDLGKEASLKGFVYAPAHAEAKPTMAFRYKIYGSMDGTKWTEIPTHGEFSNIHAQPVAANCIV